jgi:hypothetical protein
LPSRLFPLIALLCLSSALCAQTEARERYQVYGGYTFLSNSFNGVPGSRQPLNGWDASLAIPPWHHLRFKVETFAYRGTNLGSAQDALFIMGGGEYSRRIGRETVFAEGLGGDGSLNRFWGAHDTPGATASFSAILGGGLDTRVTKRLAFRAGGDFQYANFALINNLKNLIPYRIPGLPNYFGRISTGFVWKF